MERGKMTGEEMDIIEVPVAQIYRENNEKCWNLEKISNDYSF